MSGEIHSGRGLKGQAGALVLIVFLAASFLTYTYFNPPKVLPRADMNRFSSCNELKQTFVEYRQKAKQFEMYRVFEGGIVAPMMAGIGAQKAAPDYSVTNIQVAGVDEADIVKTDGEYIYTLSGEKLAIAKAYPVEGAEVLSETDLGDFYPQEIFIDSNTLLIFGSTRTEVPIPEKSVDVARAEMIYPYYAGMTTVELWDITDRSNPELVRSVDFEGSYLSSRKIGSQVYFVVNSYPKYQILEGGSVEDIIPLYRDRTGSEVKLEQKKDFVRTSRCVDIGYFEPVNPERFVTVVSMDMSNPDGEIKKEVVLGSGQNIYASLSNLYIAESSYPYWWGPRPMGLGETLEEKTIVHKFALSGDVTYQGNMEVPGRVLNQFSMDEYNDYFRIATTKGRVSRQGGVSTNNVYIYDSGLDLVGSLEDLAPGERIYSARFMGDRGYLVTFKKIDPLFAIDLSDPANPRVLGKLKIPGYSDYLHPYDDNHLIGIGKETVEAEESRGDFAWYQGVKMAIFDVTDVENPKELHKVVIGDRGTDSPILRDHKAFLFDREKSLLVIPILLAEIKGDKEKLPSNTYGDYVYQGAYVYDITLENGFNLKGRITHHETNETFLKSGYYYSDNEYSVKRSLYIDNVLYTISEKKIKLNSLDDLSGIKELVFGSES